MGVGDALLKLTLGFLSSASPKSRRQPSVPDITITTASDGYLFRLGARCVCVVVEGGG